MIFAGIDIGSRAAKVVIMKDDKIVSSAIIDTGPESVKTAYAAIETALKPVDLTPKDITYTVATGYGRILVPFAGDNVSEISCHARGINWYFPSVRTVLDMGGQDCKAINCDGKGLVTNFVMNDKCAGGTGRFLEMIADVLNVPLKDSGDLALQSNNTIAFNTICAVFAKSDAISYLRKGAARADILAGLHESIAQRSLNLLKRITIEKDFAITGGISKNKGMVRKLAEKVGMEPLMCEDPQLIGALGAALYAKEKHTTGGKDSPTKIQYGYSDGTGEYYITLDNDLCNGCGDCVTGCPAGIFTLAKNGTAPKAVVREESRKKLASLCSGKISCPAGERRNCQNICQEKAITHSW